MFCLLAENLPLADSYLKVEQPTLSLLLPPLSSSSALRAPHGGLACGSVLALQIKQPNTPTLQRLKATLFI